MKRVKMMDFCKEVGMSPNSIRYFIDTGQIPVGIKVIGQSGKPRYYLFREMIEECQKKGILKGGEQVWDLKLH